MRYADLAVAQPALSWVSDAGRVDRIDNIGRGFGRMVHQLVDWHGRDDVDVVGSRARRHYEGRRDDGGHTVLTALRSSGRLWGVIWRVDDAELLVHPSIDDISGCQR